MYSLFTTESSKSFFLDIQTGIKFFVLSVTDVQTLLSVEHT
jgi:hypothetical protein